MNKAWSESQNRKFYFQGINSWKQKLKICIDVAWQYVKKWQHVWYNMLTFYSHVWVISAFELYTHIQEAQNILYRCYCGSTLGSWSAMRRLARRLSLQTLDMPKCLFLFFDWNTTAYSPAWSSFINFTWFSNTFMKGKGTSDAIFMARQV